MDSVKELDREEIKQIVTSLQKKWDENLFGRLIEGTQKKLFIYCLYLCKQEALAKDLSQDVYVKVYDNISRIQDPASFFEWMCRVAKNLYLDFVKSPRNKPHEDVNVLDMFAKNDPENNAQEKITLDKAMKELDVDQREILVLIYVMEYSYSQVAEMINVSEAALHSRLKRAKADLKEKLELYGQNPKARSS